VWHIRISSRPDYIEGKAAMMELNPYYLDRLMNHRIQEAVKAERDRIVSLLENSLMIQTWVDWENSGLIAQIKGEQND